MGRLADSDTVQMVKKMIRDEAAGYYLLEFPDGKWGAFWSQGIDGVWADSISIGDYSEGCAFVGEAVDVAVYIKSEYMEQDTSDPLNPPRAIKPNGLIAKLLRSNSALTNAD